MEEEQSQREIRVTFQNVLRCLGRCPGVSSRGKTKAETKALSQRWKSGAPGKWLRFFLKGLQMHVSIGIYVPRTKERAVN